MICSVRIYNAPPYAYEHKYIVATYVKGLLWFYGATDDAELAREMEQDGPFRITLERTRE